MVTLHTLQDDGYIPGSVLLGQHGDFYIVFVIGRDDHGQDRSGAGNDARAPHLVIDRIAHDSYRINITSIDAEHDRSMREVYGLDKALRE